MIPGDLNLTLYRGATFGPVTFQCLNNGVPTSLAGYVAKAEVRAAANKPLVLNLNPTIPTPSNGKVLIYFTDEQTTAFTMHGEFVWDLFLINPSGERLGPFLAGSFTIKTAITRP